MPRKKGEYGLPELTLSEMARVLDVDKGELWNWIVATVKPTPNRWTEWQSDNAKTPLPEKLVRLWLVSHRRNFDAADIRKLAEQRRRAIEEKSRPAPAVMPAEEQRKKRAAGGRR